MSQISITKKVKEHIGFSYLLIELPLYTFIRLELEYIPQEVLNKIKNKSINHNIFRIQDYYYVWILLHLFLIILA